MRVEDLETQTIEPRRAEPAVPRLPELERGATIGRYVILEGLGAGGMGVVYRAFDPDLDRRVALKLVRDLTSDRTARLVREAQALAKVSHPNIVQIFDVGEFGDTVFIAMELVEGRTLAEWVRDEQPSWRTILAHAIDAGCGLAAIHAAGLVHRDFKPANVVVGEDGRVRLLDFGLARLAAEHSGSFDAALATSLAPEEAGRESASSDTLEDAPATPVADTPDDAGRHLPKIVPSRMSGTPAYMAPEQRRRGAIDARADQFAFAVACWELLHGGARPFVGDNARQYAEAARMGRFAEPPPTHRTPKAIRRALRKALAPLPSERFPSMPALLDVLAIDPARWIRRIAGGVAIASVIGAVAFAVLASRGETQRCEDAAARLDTIWSPTIASDLAAAFRATGAPIAQDTADKVARVLDRRAAAWSEMHRDACRATHIRGEQSAHLLDLRMACLERRRQELRALVEQLVTADAARVGTAVAAAEQLPSIAACSDRERLGAVMPLPDDPAKRAAIESARIELSAIRALVLTGQWRAARDRADATRRTIAAIGYIPLDAEAALLRGIAERHGGTYGAAEAVLADAARSAALAHDDDIAAEAWSELAWLVGYEDRRTLEGLVYADAAEAWAVRTENETVLANVAHTRALIELAKGDHDAALREANRALAIFEKEQEQTGKTADVLNTIGLVQSDRGDYRSAEATHRRAHAARRAELGDGHPKVADSLDNLGVVLFHDGNHTEAKRHYEAALAIRVAALGKDHRDAGTSHNNLGGLLMETGDRAGAEHHLGEALRIYELALGKDHGDLAIPLSNLGELATQRGDFERAIALCERALALDEKSGPDDPKLAYDLVCIGEASLGRGDQAGARRVLERALALRVTSDGDLGELARTRFDLARALPPSESVRARRLVMEARAGFARAGTAWKARDAEAAAWLAAHPK